MFQNVFAASRLVITCAFSLDPPNIPLAYLLFARIQSPDVYTYNIVIKASSQTLNPLKSLALYRNMLLQGLKPNEYTFCFVLTSCAHGLGLVEGKQVHCQFVKHGFDFGVYGSTSLVHVYNECGELNEGIRVFEEMGQRSNVSWGTIIDGFISRGYLKDGLRLFRDMRNSGVGASNATLVSVLCACAKMQNLKLGRMVHSYVEVRGLHLNVTLGTSLVDMYSKCGAIDVAGDVFHLMRVKSIATWNCMINGLAMNGSGDEAIKLFQEMIVLGVEPNGPIFVGVLQSCSHTGLVEDGITYFFEMSKVYRIVPNLKHYGCMVDLYGRAGRLEEAIDIIRNMAMKPDIVVWGSLLGACRIHGNAKLGELVVAQILKLQPHHMSGCTGVGLHKMFAVLLEEKKGTLRTTYFALLLLINPITTMSTLVVEILNRHLDEFLFVDPEHITNFRMRRFPKKKNTYGLKEIDWALKQEKLERHHG
ncbi:hypothetical protein GIB67_024048 [Kingdonia uniflora]|uniref:Pentatricopeptide repeat-containing protein n=1 Tax=Kingdonia uniflora TaxID=39325 RepID=A0A7J7LAT1_9MAGN|nr:hypothetical protein GIB67_024048 [Kingdonia uniflora]